VTTTCGVIRLELDGRAAPATVASFVTLARSGYWSDSVCHRLTSRQARTGFLQCGDPTGHGFGDPGYGLPLENVPADDHYVRGMVGMARGDDVNGTAGEFLMVHRDFTVRPGAPVYSVFGRVVEGQEVIDHIVARGGEDTRPDGPPFASISILTVSVVRD
jgi:peptidyl-prolyl cis-trans isomerase B (cyclophilin B)